ncbi:hypothetical protein CFP56_010497 [Quercus suber]|uniref:Uncharacterized protein n=1 Tax=Quercus suber TaxID=58331 RepID=A0AAW0M7M4_QUESU
MAFKLRGWEVRRKSRLKLGLFDGKPFKTLARFMVFVGPIVCASMLLVLIGNALGLQGTR